MTLTTPHASTGNDHADENELNFRLAPDLSNVLDSPHLTDAQVARVRSLAAHLEGHQIAVDQPVGICLRRGTGLIEAILAVWSIGAQYVPIDPDYPVERQAAIAADAGAELVVVDEATAPMIAALPVPTVPIPHDGHPAPDAGWRPSQVPAANAAAYTMFTSGSTGRPKGVCVPRESIAAFLNGTADELALGPQDAWIAVTTLCFDISLPELLIPVITGCRSVVADEETSSDATLLLELINETDATVLQVVPTMWRMLLMAGPLPPQLTTRLSAGEALAPDLAKQLLDPAHPEVAVWNQYGPTEACVYSAVTRVRPAPEDSPTGLPAIVLGPTLPGEHWYILDENLRPVRHGEVGQLWIGGIGVTRGYVANPRKTATVFLPDLAGNGQRMYATGDLARSVGDISATGSPDRIDVLGRIDHQLKIRGFRIEPGEIEVALRRVPEVSDAVVVARSRTGGGQGDGAEVTGSESGGPELVAYVAAPDEMDGGTLRSHLQDMVPAHLIPSLFQVLPVLPRNANGKIDRAALPEPRWGNDRPAEDTDPVAETSGTGEPAPAADQQVAESDESTGDPTQTALAQMWSDILGVDHVTEDDNFFVLGGHSLTAAQLVARIRADLGVRMRQRELFSHPTLVAQTQLVTERLAT